jgi:hypothetical protein
MTPGEVAALKPGAVVKFTKCADPGCGRRVAATYTKAGGVFASCNGKHDPQGLGCGARIFYGHATAWRWLQELTGERASDGGEDPRRLERRGAANDNRSAGGPTDGDSFLG